MEKAARNMSSGRPGSKFMGSENTSAPVFRDYPPPAGAVKPQGPVPYEENERRWQHDCRPPSSNIHDGNQGRGWTPSTKTGAVQLASDFRKLKPLRSHLSEDGARFAIGRNLRQLQAMGGEVDVLLSFVD
jgi:hypothetical protein